MAAGKVSRSGLQADGRLGLLVGEPPGRRAAARWWSRYRRRHGPPVDVSPAGVSVRSRVHEYGGGAATVPDGVLFYVDQADQRWYRVDAPAARRPSDPAA